MGEEKRAGKVKKSSGFAAVICSRLTLSFLFKCLRKNFLTGGDFILIDQILFQLPQSFRKVHFIELGPG